MPGRDIPGWSAAWRPDPAWIKLAPVSRDDLSLLFALVEHRAWIVAMEGYLTGERDAPPPLDHLKCRFGTWLEAEGRARLGALPAFRAVDALHRQVHLLAMELCQGKARSPGREGLTRLDELRSLRDALLEQLKVLVSQPRR